MQRTRKEKKKEKEKKRRKVILPMIDGWDLSSLAHWFQW